MKESQTALLLRGPRQPYELVTNYPIPPIEHDAEVLIKGKVIGLNPIDWKAPDFNFGIPQLPHISGRELAGEVVQVASEDSSYRIGDRVVAISTDYRDLRKAAYQEYVVALSYNIAHLPQSWSYEDGSTIGVAFVAASLALGVSLGLDFSSVWDGPDLFKTLRKMSPDQIPEDVRTESLASLREEERLKPGDWIAIWGGSATSANLTMQLAKLFGLKVAVVVDQARHGSWLSQSRTLRPDLLVDSHDAQRAIHILVTNTGGKLRHGIDTRGRETAGHLLEALSPCTSSVWASPEVPGSLQREKRRAHLVGMTGVPKDGPTEGSVFHSVPIKLFHEVRAVGGLLTTWLETLLQRDLIVPARILDTHHGLQNVNEGLNRMRDGHIRGGKVVVTL